MSVFCWVISFWLPDCRGKDAERSRSNFAVNLVRRLFTTEERKISNVKGVMGKRKLDPDVMQQIKGATFQLFPCDTMENEGHVWTYCCKAIDECCHRLNRVKEKENMHPVTTSV